MTRWWKGCKFFYSSSFYYFFLYIFSLSLFKRNGIHTDGKVSAGGYRLGYTDVNYKQKSAVELL